MLVAGRLAPSLCVFLLGAALAQVWTVQTAAFRDYHEAVERVGELTALGFNAYTEVAMSAGEQYVRVRVGCFLDSESAASVAAALQGVTEEAVVVPLSPGAPVSPCLSYELGFRLPERWEVFSTTPEAILFRVERPPLKGFIGFDGLTWRVLQEAGEAWQASAPAQDLFLPFRAFSQNARLYARTSRGSLCLGQGRLLWQAERVAVARVGTMIVAVRLAAGPRYTIGVQR